MSMRSLLRVALALLLLAFVLIGLCWSMLRSQGQTGPLENRIVSTERRSISAALRVVELSGPIDLTLRYGPEPSLTVRGEQRVLANVETREDGKLLLIGTRGIVLRHRQPISVELTLPALESLSTDGSGDSQVSGFSGEAITLGLTGSGSIAFNGRYRQLKVALHGSGDLTLDAGNADTVEAELNGSGTMTLAGASRDLQAVASGSGSLDAQRLRSEHVKVRQSGSGDSSVNARSSVEASVSGTGDIDVHGKPTSRSVHRSGSGAVHFEED